MGHGTCDLPLPRDAKYPAAVDWWIDAEDPPWRILHWLWIACAAVQRANFPYQRRGEIGRRTEDGAAVRTKRKKIAIKGPPGIQSKHQKRSED